MRCRSFRPMYSRVFTPESPSPKVSNCKSPAAVLRRRDLSQLAVRSIANKTRICSSMPITRFSFLLVLVVVFLCFGCTRLVAAFHLPRMPPPPVNIAKCDERKEKYRPTCLFTRFIFLKNNGSIDFVHTRSYYFSFQESLLVRVRRADPGHN